jgi:hypothetical protein
VVLSGCSTASWVIHKNPNTEMLLYSEKDVDRTIEELSREAPKDPDAVVYNRTADVYEMKPAAYKNALRDGIVKKIQEEKVEAFLKEYRSRTFWDAVKDDLGTTVFVVVIISAVAAVIF